MVTRHSATFHSHHLKIVLRLRSRLNRTPMLTGTLKTTIQMCLIDFIETAQITLSRARYLHCHHGIGKLGLSAQGLTMLSDVLQRLVFVARQNQQKLRAHYQ